MEETKCLKPSDSGHDIPQGSPLSPLLANLYMRRFVLGWKKLGLEQSLGARLVTYADDLVILCRRGAAEAALHHLREIMGKLKLTVNEDKTRICKVPEGEFDFLGYTFGRMYSPTTGQAWPRPVVGEGVRSCPRAGCREIRMSGSMSGVWKRSYGRPAKAPPDERGGNRHGRPNATAPHPDSTPTRLYRDTATYPFSSR
jgi:hypothetical protein